MLDIVNFLNQKHLAHRNITTQHFLVSSSLDYPAHLKLFNFRFASPINPTNPVYLVSEN